MIDKISNIDKYEIANTVAELLYDVQFVTEEQVYFYMVKQGKIPNDKEAFIKFKDELDSAVWYQLLDGDALIGEHQKLHESFDLYTSVHDRNISLVDCYIDSALTVPDALKLKEQPIHVEVWAEGDSIVSFLRTHLEAEVYEATSILKPAIRSKTADRLEFMKEVAEKECIVVYLGDFEEPELHWYQEILEFYEKSVDQFDRIGINNEQIKDLPLNIFRSHHDHYVCNEKMSSRNITMESGYSLHSINPDELIRMVVSPLTKYLHRFHLSSDRFRELERISGRFKIALKDYLEDIRKLYSD